MDILEKQRNFYNSGRTKDLRFRLALLKSLKTSIKSRVCEILDALQKDLNKSKTEAFLSEIYPVLDELNFFIKNLKKWEKPVRVKSSLIHFSAKSCVYNEPYGLALIISPWNYPFQLPIMSLIGAVAAGNCVVLKLSEHSAFTSDVVAKIINEVFDGAHVRCVLGEADVSESLLKEKFDYIFYTGNSQIGKCVMHAAADNLTPVTLELGGKSPCFVDMTANLEVSAQRIVWGKFLNSGQTCVAPDYVLVQQTVADEFVEKLKKYIQEFYSKTPLKNPDYPKIINEKHFLRLNNLLTSSDIIAGGDFDSETLKIEPTLLRVSWTDEVMKEEIFGPLLPIIEYSSLDEVIDRLKNMPKPLALYCFTEDMSVADKVLSELEFGGGCINDTIFHLTNPELPFGGVGYSGMGAYHGKASYETFTHKKSILKKSTRFSFPIQKFMFNKKLDFVKFFLKFVCK